MSGELTTLAAVKQWLLLTGTGASDDVLNTLISACSTYIQNWLNRTIALATYTEVRNGLGTPLIVTQQFPIVSVASVTVDGVPIQPRPALAPNMTSSCFGGYVFSDIAIMLSGGVFPRGVQNVQFVYDAGYASVPPDIDHACVEMIGDWFKYSNRIGMLSEGIEGQTISFTNVPITSRAQGVLNQYKKVYQ
jgi:hypothetical protein